MPDMTVSASVTDDKLLRLIREQPEKGMDLLMRTYTGLLCTVVRGQLTGSPFVSTDIEDCVADAFSNFYTHLDTFDPSVCSIRSYLIVIARRNAVNTAIRRAPEWQIVQADDEDIMLEIPDGALSPDAETAEHELCEYVMSAIEAMGPPDSDILIRKYYYNQSADIIATRLGLTVSNVNTRAHRALGKLRKQFGGAGK